MTPATRSRARSARGKVLRLLSSAGRPVTGGEVLGYALTSSTAAEVSPLMAELVADGLVVANEVYHPNAHGRRSRCYQLAELAGVEGGTPL